MTLTHVLKSLALVATMITATVSGLSSNSSKEFDYVVIGSGAGGGTVAAALARQGHSVFLIEAGGDHGDSLLQQIPALSSSAAEDETMSWQFFIRHFRNETQGRRDSKFVYRIADGSLYTGLNPPEGAEALGTFYPRGATLGGSSQVHAMNFARAPDEDWDYFARLTGDESWSARAMEQYFVNTEKCLYRPTGTPGHGFDGFISSSHNNFSAITDSPGFVEFFSGAAKETEGINVHDTRHLTDLMERDLNSDEHLYAPGVFGVVNSWDEKSRRSAIRDYIMDTIAAGFPLTISKPLATGVEYMVGEGLYAADRRYDAAHVGELRNITATKEVIVAGGAFNTPQILKLSGIGPKEELDRWNIPVIVDLPGVGLNLKDHAEGPIVFNGSAPWSIPSLTCTSTFDASDPCFVAWNESGSGPYGNGGVSNSFRIRSNYSETWKADIWMIGVPSVNARGFYPGFSHPEILPSAWAWAMVKSSMPGDSFSNGTVTLKSANPRDSPVINFDSLQGEEGQRDLNALTESAEMLARIYSNMSEPYAPSTGITPPNRADSVTQWIKDEAFGHHASSSCRMGHSNDTYACVDSKLRVRGVDGLRIVDASVFPYPPGAFPFLSIYMMGLKAADVIGKSRAGGP